MTSVKGRSAGPVPAANEPHFALLAGNLMEQVRNTIAGQDWGGLRASHFRTMSYVPREGVTITELGARIGLTKQASGQFVSFLIESGHLETRTDPRDLRARVVVRTPLGDRAVKSFNARLLRLERQWARVVGPQRYAEFRRVLRDLNDSL